MLKKMGNQNGRTRPPAVDGIKSFDNDDKAAKHYCCLPTGKLRIVAGNSNVLQPGHHYQNFKFHQQQEALAAHFDFTSFSAWLFLGSWPQLFYTRGVLVGILFLGG